MGVVVQDVRLLGGIGEKKSNKGTQYYEQDRIYDSECLATSVITNFHPWYATKERKNDMSSLRIRKLTPKECFKLMGFSEKDYQSIRDIGLSDSAIWHMAGDSIVTTCLMGLIGQLLPISENQLQHTIQGYVETLKEN